MKRDRNQRYRNKHKMEMREYQRNYRLVNHKMWLKLAFLKAGGDPLDWPVYRNPESVK